MPDLIARPSVLSCAGIDIVIGNIVVTRALNLNIAAGQCWCVLGKNGVGKTTLLHTLAGLRAPACGQIRLHGRPLNQLRRREVAQQLGILFQDHEDSFPATVLETVLQGRHPHLHPWQWESADDHRIAKRAITQLQLDELEQRNVQTLSGGERRRVGIATLLTQNTDLMLLDEPTNHLDLHHRLKVLEILVDQCRNTGKAALMILHDINLAARFADHLLLIIGDGETRLGRAADVLQTDTLERLYSHPLQRLETPGGPVWLPR